MDPFFAKEFEDAGFPLCNITTCQWESSANYDIKRCMSPDQLSFTDSSLSDDDTSEWSADGPKDYDILSDDIDDYDPILNSEDCTTTSTYDALSPYPYTLRRFNDSHTEQPSQCTTGDSFSNFEPKIPSLPTSRKSVIVAREPSPYCTYQAFAPSYIISASKHLENGFPKMVPGSKGEPYPFDTHDILLDEWYCFLQSIKKVADTSRSDQLCPLGLQVSMFSFLHITKNLSRNQNLRAIVDEWNCDYFHPRHVEVILTKGDKRLDSGGRLVPCIDTSIESRPTTHQNKSNAGQEVNANKGIDFTFHSYNPLRTLFSQKSDKDKLFRLFFVPL